MVLKRTINKLNFDKEDETQINAETYDKHTTYSKIVPLEFSVNVNDTANHNNYESDVSTTILNMKSSLTDKLSNWVVSYNVSQGCVNSLLGILASENLKVPLDCRTLMKTPRCISNVIELETGSLKHFGIERGITYITAKDNIKEFYGNAIKLMLNIDGLPISASSKSQFWPILIKISNSTTLSLSTFPVVVFHGYGKPKPLNDFLKSFLDEFKLLNETGIYVLGKKYKIEIDKIICDAPAKAFLLNIKGHNGYFGCNQCIQEGEYINGKMTFPEINATLRTDDSFKNKTDENHHKEGNTPLLQLNVGLVSSVPFDYMHLVCIGVVKKLISFWVKGDKQVRLRNLDIMNLNKALKNLRSYIPKEFARLPRPATEIEYWKATELRQFLLYTGVIVLEHLLTRKFYKHFLLLHCSIKILASPDLYYSYNSQAENMLKMFVSMYSQLYGRDNVTYNVHGLVHLAENAKRHGPLDCFSAFPFENYLQVLKKKYKHSRNPLQQISNRIAEQLSLRMVSTEKLYPQLMNELDYCSDFLKDRKYYRKIIFENYSIELNERDNFILTHNEELIKIDHITKKGSLILFLGRKYVHVEKLYSTPLSSEVIYEYRIKEEFTELAAFSDLDIKSKCICIKLQSSSILLGLAHDLKN